MSRSPEGSFEDNLSVAEFRRLEKLKQALAEGKRGGLGEELTDIAHRTEPASAASTIPQTADSSVSGKVPILQVPDKLAKAELIPGLGKIKQIFQEDITLLFEHEMVVHTNYGKEPRKRKGWKGRTYTEEGHGGSRIVISRNSQPKGLPTEFQDFVLVEKDVSHFVGEGFGIYSEIWDAYEEFLVDPENMDVYMACWKKDGHRVKLFREYTGNEEIVKAPDHVQWGVHGPLESGKREFDAMGTYYRVQSSYSGRGFGRFGGRHEALDWGAHVDDRHWHGVK